MKRQAENDEMGKKDRTGDWQSRILSLFDHCQRIADEDNLMKKERKKGK
jgi:hypothetical protein